MDIENGVKALLAINERVIIITLTKAAGLADLQCLQGLLLVGLPIS